MEAAPSSRPDIPGTSAGQWCPLVVAAQPGSAARIWTGGVGEGVSGGGGAVLAHGDTREALTPAPCGWRGVCSVSGGWRSGAGQMGGPGCRVRAGPRGPRAWVAPGRVITPRLNSRCVPGPNAEVSWGLLLYCISGTKNSHPQASSWQMGLLPCHVVPWMGPPLTARCFNGGTGGKGRPPEN